MKTIFKYFFVASVLVLGSSPDTTASPQCDLIEKTEFNDKYYTPFLQTLDVYDYHELELADNEKDGFLTKELTKSANLTTEMDQKAREMNCPFHKGFLYYMAGATTLKRVGLYHELKRIRGESNPSEETKLASATTEAQRYFEEAESQFKSRVDPLNSEKFQEIYAGEHGLTLFIYGLTLKHLEGLEKDTVQRLAYLEQLDVLVTELSKNRSMYLGAPSFKETSKDFRNNIFSALGYAGWLKTNFSYLPIDHMFLKDPTLILFSINIQRKSLTIPDYSFESRFDDWMPKLIEPFIVD